MDRNKIDRLDASSSTDIAKYAPAACIARGHLENKIFFTDCASWLSLVATENHKNLFLRLKAIFGVRIRNLLKHRGTFHRDSL